MEAIAACKRQILADPTNVALHDKLAFRLLNCALWHMRAEPPRPDEAATLLLEVTAHCSNARTMATVVQLVSSEFIASGGLKEGVAIQPNPTILHAVTTLIQAALTIATAQPIAFDDSDYVADLAVAHCDMGCTVTTTAGVLQFCQPSQLAMWALGLLPTIAPTTLQRLCLHAKQGAPDDFAAFIDAVAKLEGKCKGPVALGGATAAWRELGGTSGPKAMMLVLDLSYSMDCDGRLPTCKQSLTTILTEHIGPADRAGLLTFADDVQQTFPLTLGGPPDGPDRKSMLGAVQGLRTRGMTAFYSAVAEGASKLASEMEKEPNVAKWLVALTDGADNRSTPGAPKRAVDVLSSTPGLNLALITVGDDIDMRVCKRFLDAASGAGNQSMLVKASNQKEISEAFAAVAAAMTTGVAEVL